MKISPSQFLFFAFLVAAAFLFFKNRGPSTEQLKQLAESKDSIWIDVREKDEVVSGTIAGSYWIPLSMIQGGASALEQTLSKLDPSKNWLLFCRSGNRSNVAKNILEKMGYKVQNVGGFSNLASTMSTTAPNNPVPGQLNP